MLPPTPLFPEKVAPSVPVILFPEPMFLCPPLFETEDRIVLAASFCIAEMSLISSEMELSVFKVVAKASLSALMEVTLSAAILNSFRTSPLLVLSSYHVP